MIRSLTFVNRFGRSLCCTLGEPERSGFAITNITGLGPGNASVNIHDIATADGGYFGSARFSARNIVITFQLMDVDFDNQYVPIEEVRHRAYEFFAPKNQIRIVIDTDTRSLVIDGYVESDDPNIFQPDVTTTVSILCPGYYFKMASDTGSGQTSTIYGSGLFQFPFSNESLTKKLIQFGSIERTQKYEMPYDGDAETGFELEIQFNGLSVKTINIQNTPLGNSEKGPVGFAKIEDSQRAVLQWSDFKSRSSYVNIDLSKITTKLSGSYSKDIYSSGNRIVIRSMVGQKTAIFIDEDQNEYNIVDAIDHLEWLKIYPGYNEFSIVTDAASVGHFAINVNFEALYTGV